MLRAANDLISYSLMAHDGEVGRCQDFLFDDESWVIRYLVADTGKWMPGRTVLISPITFGEVDWRSRRFYIRMSKVDIEHGPSLDEDAPVSRQYELQLAQHYAYLPYWMGTGLWGNGIYPAELYGVVPYEEKDSEAPKGDPHMRSIKEVVGYHIRARDGEMGHVEDFIVEDQTWKIRHIVVDTRNWLPSPKVIVSPDWIEAVSWNARKVSVSLTMKEVRDAPKYDPGAPVNREYELRLYDYYGRPRYW